MSKIRFTCFYLIFFINKIEDPEINDKQQFHSLNEFYLRALYDEMCSNKRSIDFMKQLSDVGSFSSINFIQLT